MVHDLLFHSLPGQSGARSAGGWSDYQAACQGSPETRSRTIGGIGMELLQIKTPPGLPRFGQDSSAGGSWWDFIPVQLGEEAKMGKAPRLVAGLG